MLLCNLQAVGLILLSDANFTIIQGKLQLPDFAYHFTLLLKRTLQLQCIVFIDRVTMMSFTK